MMLVLELCLISNAQKHQDVEAFFKPKQTFSNPVTAKIYFLEDSLKCSNTLVLNSDSTFLREIGCEGHSFVTVGNWRQFKDLIELKALKQEYINFIHSVKTIHNQSDTMVIFYFTDKLGQPIRLARLVEPFRINKTNNSRLGTIIFGVEQKTDNHGMIYFNKSEKWDSLNFFRFHALTNKPSVLAYQNLPSEIHIQLDINNLAFIYSDFKYYYFDKPKVFKFTDEALETNRHIWQRIKP